jgi:NADPH:quinone reductase-like Zn-dependent oxidoreductase
MTPFSSQRVRAAERAAEMAANQVDLVALTELIGSGKASPVIDRTYTLVEVPDAIRDFQDGHTRGKHVITV